MKLKVVDVHPDVPQEELDRMREEALLKLYYYFSDKEE